MLVMLLEEMVILRVIYRMMADNAGIPFYTPEEYFLGVPVDSIPWTYPSNPVIPSRQRWTSYEYDVFDRLYTMCARTDRLTVIMGVGYPGSGKSGWVKKFRINYQGEY